MKFALFLLNQWLPQEDMAAKIQEGVEQVKAAREAGFDMVCTGQHYLSYPYQMPTTLPYLAHLAPAAEGMYIGATVLLLPLLPPVEVAESVATLDAMSGGRFILGVGQGYRAEENIAFGTGPTLKERAARMMESLEVMKLLWTQEEVEFHGDYYHIPRVKIATRTTQKPYPPIWVAANSDRAVRRAARAGYPWLINPHTTIGTLEGQVGMYRAAAAQGEHAVGGLPILREMYVHQGSAAAFEHARPYLEPKYQAYAAWGQDEVPGQESFRVPFETLAKDRFLLGDPGRIVEEVYGYQERLGVDRMVFRIQWPGMPHKDVMRQLELFGKRVAPAFPRFSG
ncbi:MAG: LLM class flavin-dependent oxidoreductase [Chloroflexi bacterium]|nr:LLM class flavin-dependent oxidoreductase [Chloroflexota bacterium]